MGCWVGDRCPSRSRGCARRFSGRGGRCRRHCASARRRSCTGSRPGSSRPSPLWPWRTGPGAAWPGWRAGRHLAPTDRGRGSRIAARRRWSEGRRASRRHRPRPGVAALRDPPRRTGTDPPGRQSQRKAKSWCRRRRKWPRGGRPGLARRRCERCYACDPVRSFSVRLRGLSRGATPRGGSDRSRRAGGRRLGAPSRLRLRAVRGVRGRRSPPPRCPG